MHSETNVGENLIVHKKKNRRISLLLATILLIACIFPRNAASAASVGDATISAAGAIVLDVETGMTIYEHNADVMRAPASMTKLMTVYLVYEAIAAGRIGFDTIVPITQYAADFSRQAGETNVPLSRSGRYTVDELLDVVLVMSAGGAAVALAELVGGSRSAFYRMMNNKAAQWGVDAIYYSASGGSTHTRLSPRAQATLARNFVLDYPEVLEKTSKSSVTFGGRRYESTNQLLGVYEGIDGLKTGTHSMAGACFTGTAQRGGTRLVTVVMGSTSARRFSDTTTLLDYGFAAMEELRSDREAQELAELEARKVPPIASPVYVDGVETDFEAYLIEDRNYFRIRDLAYALDGTPAQFNVEWDDETRSIVFTSGARYIANGTEMAGRNDERKLPEPTTARISVDGSQVVFNAYSIEGNNFFALRDIADTFDFGVAWNEETRAIYIETGA